MVNQLPSLNSLRAFEVVSRRLSYHAAAEELNVTPAAVKQLVSKLETTVGVKLLERDGQGLKLTPRGKLSCEYLTSAMQQLKLSVEKMKGSEQHRQLIVTVEMSFATAWLVPKLVHFRKLFPQISVLIDSNQQIEDINNGSADIAIRYGVKSSSENFVHRLFDDQIFPACSPTLANGPPKISNLQDLNLIPLIHWDMTHLEWVTETKKWFEWKRWLECVGASKVSVSNGIYFSDYGLAIQAAIAGQGMVLASYPILKEAINSKILVCPFDERVATDIGYDLVTTQSALSRPEVKAFVDWLIEAANLE
jgi:LysR family glycine cleavage system transcriptional activator